MKAFRRSISTLRPHHRSGKELTDQIKVLSVEDDHLFKLQQPPTHGESLTNSTGNVEMSLTAPLPTTEKKWFHQVNGKVVSPQRRNLKGSRSLSPQAAINSHRIRSKSLDHAALKQHSQETLSNESLLDITLALRYVDDHIGAAKKLGKPVSRSKVMGALLTVLDHLDVQQDKEKTSKSTVIEYNPPQKEDDIESTDSTRSHTTDDRSESSDSLTFDDGEFAADFRKQVPWLMDPITDLLFCSMGLNPPPPPSPRSKTKASRKRGGNAYKHPRPVSKRFSPLARSKPRSIAFRNKKSFFPFSRFKKSAATRSEMVPTPEPLVVQRTRSRSASPRKNTTRTPMRDEPVASPSRSPIRWDRRGGSQEKRWSRSKTPPARLPNNATRSGPPSVTSQSTNTTSTMIPRNEQAKTWWFQTKPPVGAASGGRRQRRTRQEEASMSCWFPTFDFLESDEYQQALADIFFIETKPPTKQNSRFRIFAKSTPPLCEDRIQSRTKIKSSNDKYHHQKISPKHDDDTLSVVEEEDWPQFSAYLRRNTPWPE